MNTTRYNYNSDSHVLRSSFSSRGHRDYPVVLLYLLIAQFVLLAALYFQCNSPYTDSGVLRGLPISDAGSFRKSLHFSISLLLSLVKVNFDFTNRVQPTAILYYRFLKHVVIKIDNNFTRFWIPNFPSKNKVFIYYFFFNKLYILW